MGYIWMAMELHSEISSDCEKTFEFIHYSWRFYRLYYWVLSKMSFILIVMKIWYCYIFNAVFVTVYFKDNAGIRINACFQKNIVLSHRWVLKKKKALSSLGERKLNVVVSYRAIFSKTGVKQSMRIKGKQFKARRNYSFVCLFYFSQYRFVREFVTDKILI